MSRSRSFRDFYGSVFFFFYMPRGSFFQISAIFWHRDRGVKFSPRSENCARRAKTPLPPKLRPEDLGGPRHRREDGAARRRPGPPSIFTLPIRQRDDFLVRVGGCGGEGRPQPLPPGTRQRAGGGALSRRCSAPPRPAARLAPQAACIPAGHGVSEHVRGRSF